LSKRVGLLIKHGRLDRKFAALPVDFAGAKKGGVQKSL
jgi:hypothetical protein